jgi:hypothetical protein
MTSTSTYGWSRGVPVQENERDCHWIAVLQLKKMREIAVLQLKFISISSTCWATTLCRRARCHFGYHRA